jgi:dipeptidyl aminopeptidase/acylaminoacyl peptidase
VRIPLLLLTALLMTTPSDAADKRPMTLDDLFKLKRVADPQISPDGKQVVYQVTEITDVASNKKHTHLWLAATDGKTPPRQLTASGKSDTHPRWSPDGTQILFQSTRSGSGQLHLLDLKNGGEAKQLTTISTGAETGIWSPDGKLIAFVSAVYPEFSELPFAESDKKNAEKDEAIEKNPVKAKTFTKLFYRHWDSYVGDKRQHLFVLDLGEAHGRTSVGTPRDVTPGDRDAYPTSSTFSVGDDFTFTPDNKHILFTAVPEKGEAWSTNHDICRVSIDNKSTKWESLTSENKAADTYPKFSPDGKKLAWRSQKKAGYEADKWDILVSYVNPDGTLVGAAKNVTAIKDVSVSEFIWMEPTQLLFTFDSCGLARLAIAGAESGAVAFVENNRGLLSGLSYADMTLVCSSAQMATPAEVISWRMVQDAPNVKTPLNLSNANTTYLTSIDRNHPESVQVKIEDGEMQMWLLKPPGFDASKKYPVVYLIHGGPQGAWEDGWSWRWNPQLWAAQGYVIAMPNPRGSTGFGQKFCDEISGDWGGKCYRDLVAGLEHVKKLPYVDKDRMGSAGASFGGYMQNWFAVNEISKEFKCLITHCSVYNFESMWGTTEELWFDEYEHGGLPWEIPGKYREFSPHIKAGNLGKFKTPMLIIHNDLDFRCPIGQGHELFTALQRQGVPSRFVNFPDEGHWVLKPANSKHWHTEVFSWLTKHVPPGGR